MASDWTRRGFLGATGMAVAAGATRLPSAKAAGEAPGKGKIRIVGVSCSPRKGKTTAAGLKVCLDAAAKVSPAVETELVELAGMDIPVFDPTARGAKGDFARLVPKLSDPAVGGIIVGTPVYFCNMTSLCKAFLDHCMVFRKNKLALANKVGGVLAVGGVRNGGQELTIQTVQAALMCQEMIVVGDGRPTAHIGATLVNQGDDVSGDDFGLGTARNLGRRVAQTALLLAGRTK